MKIRLFMLLVIAFAVYQIGFNHPNAKVLPIDYLQALFSVKTLPSGHASEAQEQARAASEEKFTQEKAKKQALLSACFNAYNAKEYQKASIACEKSAPYLNNYGWYTYADIKYNIAQYDDALVAINKALALTNASQLAWQIKFLNYKKLILMSTHNDDDLDNINKIEQQIASLEPHQKVAPRSDYIANEALDLSTTGNSAYSQGFYQDALDAYDQSLQKVAGNRYTMARRGDALFMLQRYDEAIRQYTQLIESKGEDWDAWIKKGIALYAIGEYQQIIDLYNNSDLKKNHLKKNHLRTPEMLYLQCAAFDKLDRVDEASACMQQLGEFNPQSDERLKWFYLIGAN